MVTIPSTRLLLAALALGVGALACTAAASKDGSDATAGADGAAVGPVSGAPAVVDATAGGASVSSSSAAGTGGSGAASGAGAASSAQAGAGGAGGSAGAAAGGVMSTAGAGGAGTGGPAGAGGAAADPLTFADGLRELLIHDACTGPNPSQPDTCLHAQQTEHAITFGGQAGTVYDVTLRVRGLFEPTTISGGETPMPDHPYFKVGGTVTAMDYSHWHLEVSDPPQTYWLNHYPSTSHTIYQEDFEAVIPIAAGAGVVVRVIDANDREIDNAAMGPADRRKLIDGVTIDVLDGQVLRLDVIDVEAR